LSLTKVRFPKASYHKVEANLTWPSGVTTGDIVDVFTSLGGYGKSLEVESFYGDTQLQLNVCEQIRGTHENLNPWLANGAFYSVPLPSGEVAGFRDTITVPSGSTWSTNQHIRDFKVVAISAGTKIIFSL